MSIYQRLTAYCGVTRFVGVYDGSAEKAKLMFKMFSNGAHK